MSVCKTTNDDGSCTFRCTQCALQFLHVKDSPGGNLRRRNKITDSYAAYLAKQKATDCETLRKAIRGSLAKHGNAILSRWKKKSKEKRAALMLKVYPSIEPYEYFEVAANQARAVPKGDEFDWHDDPIVQARSMPFFNLETLQQDPMRFLSLLHHRSHARLEEWVPYDLSRLEEVCRRVDGRATFLFNLNCVIMRGSRLGNLVPHDQDKCHTLELVGFPMAYSVLSMQFKLLMFLNATVNNIINSTTTPAPEGNDRWLALLSTGFKLSGSVECWSPFANAFSNPPLFDPLQCLQHVNAHLTEAEDELKLAQTSPEYFQSIPGFHIEAAPVKSHKILHGSTTAVYSEGRRAVDTIMAMMEKVIGLRWLAKQVELVAGARCEQGASYDKALAGLYKMASELCQSSRLDFGEMLRASAAFGSSYETTNGHGPGKSPPAIPHPKIPQMFHKDRLHWYLYLIYGLRPSDNSTEEASLFASLEEHLEKADHAERSRVDTNMLMQLSTIAIYQEIKTNIALSFPRLIRREAEKSYDAYLTEINKKRGPAVSTQYPSRQGPRFALLELRSQSWPKGQRNQDWLAKADKARRYLSALWDAAREEYKDGLVGMGLPESCAIEIISGLKADHASEHLLDVTAERAEVLQQTIELKVRPAVAVAGMLDPAQTFWGGAGYGTKIELATDRIKPKTRPDRPALEESQVKHKPDALAPCAKQAQISVNAESVRIFSKLFVAGIEPSKGIVKWQQIVTAIADAGLIGTNLGGSAVGFKSSSNEGSIVFHKPHPDPNVDLIHQRNMGKRLHKWFGWTAETFVERQKAKKEKTAENEDAAETQE